MHRLVGYAARDFLAWLQVLRFAPLTHPTVCPAHRTILPSAFPAFTLATHVFFGVSSNASVMPSCSHDQ